LYTLSEISLAERGIYDFTPEVFDDGVIISNMFCDFLFLSREEFFDFIKNGYSTTDIFLKKKLIKKRFIYDIKDDFIETSVDVYRKLKGFQFVGTVLHIFVLTLDCNLKCTYCQATAGNQNCSKKMTINVADSCVSRAFETLSGTIDIEFQGGEPLLNFPVLRYIVEKSNALAKQTDKIVSFSLISNLSLLTEEIAEYLAKNNINVSVSLDGPKDVHDFNRPHMHANRSNFDDVVKGIQTLNKFYATSNGRISGLLTSTRKSLSRVDEIIDIYDFFKFDTISVRPVDQLGMARNNWDTVGYTPLEFGAYYNEFLEKLLARNISKKSSVVEYHARMFSQKIFNKTSINHMEFRSPCGAAIGQITYNWNGEAYTCDEGRMLAALGDDTFSLGSVFDNSYDMMMKSSKVQSIANASCLESLPDCSYCVYQPLCGVCPVYNYSKYGDLYRSGANDYFCQIRKVTFDAYFKNLLKGSDSMKNMLIEWGSS